MTCCGERDRGRRLLRYHRWEMRRAWIILLSWVALAWGSEEVVSTSHSTSSLSINMKGGAFRRVRRPCLSSSQPRSASYHQSPEFCGTFAGLKVLLQFTCARSRPTLYDPMDCSPPCSPWNSPARILEWFVIFFSRRASQPRGRTRVSCIAGSSLPAEPQLLSLWGQTVRTAAGVMARQHTKYCRRRNQLLK